MIEIKHRTTGAVLLRLDRANLCGADLRDAYLYGADLRDADLRDAYLRGAGLYDADLRDADLRGADLCGACLGGAYLCGACLGDADLGGAYLCGADLRGANLGGAYLCGANLCDTCLDPDAHVPAIADAEIITAGLLLDGDHVTGWRTARSQHVGSQVYEPGQSYSAPVFSIADTACHPGLYLAGEAWCRREYPDVELVRVRCLRADLHHAGDKWRCRSFEVLP